MLDVQHAEAYAAQENSRIIDPELCTLKFLYPPMCLFPKSPGNIFPFGE